MVFYQLAARIAPPSSGPISIRGAALGRVRRNAISLNGDKTLPGTRVAVGKPLEIWRTFVSKRWDPQSRFLNLEVCRTPLDAICFFTYAPVSECLKMRYSRELASYHLVYPGPQERRQQ